MISLLDGTLQLDIDLLKLCLSIQCSSMLNSVLLMLKSLYSEEWIEVGDQILTRLRRHQCNYILIYTVAQNISFISSIQVSWMLPLSLWCMELVFLFSFLLLPSLISICTLLKDSWLLTSCNSHPPLMTRWPRMQSVFSDGLPSFISSLDIGWWVANKSSRMFIHSFLTHKLLCLLVILSITSWLTKLSQWL